MGILHLWLCSVFGAHSHYYMINLMLTAYIYCDFRDHPDSPACFTTCISHNRGALAAIYTLVPEKLHEHMVHLREFRTTVHSFFLYTINISTSNYIIIVCSVYCCSKHREIDSDEQYCYCCCQHFWHRGQSAGSTM